MVRMTFHGGAGTVTGSLQGKDGLRIQTLCTHCNSANIQAGGLSQEFAPVILDEFRVDEETGEMIGNIEIIDGRWGASLEIGPVSGDSDPNRGRHTVPAGGRWGDWNTAGDGAAGSFWGFRGVGWVVALAALALLVLHMVRTALKVPSRSS